MRQRMRRQTKRERQPRPVGRPSRCHLGHTAPHALCSGLAPAGPWQGVRGAPRLYMIPDSLSASGLAGCRGSSGAKRTDGRGPSNPPPGEGGSVRLPPQQLPHGSSSDKRMKGPRTDWQTPPTAPAASTFAGALGGPGGGQSELRVVDQLNLGEHPSPRPRRGGASPPPRARSARCGASRCTRPCPRHSQPRPRPTLHLLHDLHLLQLHSDPGHLLLHRGRRLLDPLLLPFHDLQHLARGGLLHLSVPVHHR